ncbi:hypothetical protein HYG86_09340 [Alkalicella caledoniensis]|uniref:Uncharacterized protein n=1 Tax=Alkalicella caledoniensis TaxID=2731377 RepID=A0A7G9W8F3_ALKCA|nr:hypothetical protein [Alkalicella caledoniensis]QNO14965.1 hypothetical protein HYG86_09340 [Alkalicella caledoniensis]
MKINTDIIEKISANGITELSNKEELGKRVAISEEKKATLPEEEGIEKYDRSLTLSGIIREVLDDIEQIKKDVAILRQQVQQQ